MDVFADCDDLACTSERVKQASRVEGERQASTTASSCGTGTRGATAASRSCSCSSSTNGRAVEPVSLTATLDADVPSKPFGDASEYTFSPDGSEARVQRARQGQVGAVVDELRSLRSGRRRRRAAQSHGRQSGLGRAARVLAATAACSRGARCNAPGFEADRFHVVVAGSEDRRAPRADAGLGPLGRLRSRSRPTARTLYAIDGSLRSAPAVGDRREDRQADDADRTRAASNRSPSARSEIVFALSSLKSPAEL